MLMVYLDAATDTGTSGLVSGLGVLWVLAGIVGFVMLLAKGKLGFGCVTWILFGWWGLLLAVVIGGPILLVAGLMAHADVTCPYCRRRVNYRATKCPHCHSDLSRTGAGPTPAILASAVATERSPSTPTAVPPPLHPSTVMSPTDNGAGMDFNGSQRPRTYLHLLRSRM